MELPSGLNIHNLFNIRHKIKAINDDYLLFQKCLQLNPGYELPHHDPKVYQSKPWINKDIQYHSLSHYLETKAILMQLFSRFAGSEKTENMNKIGHYSFQNILYYIQENITQDISVTRLAEMAYTSRDHFTRTFKSIIGMPPSEYIIRKRLEKAKLLLLTTDASLSEIISLSGFHTTAYFCRIFKKYTSYTPEQFRRNRG
jgi:AraC-like DNA-binding protein